MGDDIIANKIEVEEVNSYDQFLEIIDEYISSQDINLEVNGLEQVESLFEMIDRLFCLHNNRTPLYIDLVKQIKNFTSEPSQQNMLWRGFNCLGPSFFFNRILQKMNVEYEIVCTPNSPHPYFIIYDENVNYLASFGDSFIPSAFTQLNRDPSNRLILLNSQDTNETFKILDLLSNFSISYQFEQLDFFIEIYKKALAILDNNHPILAHWKSRAVKKWPNILNSTSL